VSKGLGNRQPAPGFREGFQNSQLASKHSQLHEVKETARAYGYLSLFTLVSK